MPQTIYGNQVGTETLRAGDTLTVTVDAGSGGIVEQYRGGARIAGTAISTTTSFGPFVDDMTMRVSSYAGATLTTSTADQNAARGNDATAAAVAALVAEYRNTAYVDFTAKADGAPPSVMDSGQVVDYTFNATGRRPVIASGRLVVENQASAGSGSLADYFQATLREAAIRVGCEWTQPSGSDDGNGNATYAAWGSVYEGGGLNIPNTWCHMSIVPGTGATGTAKWWCCDNAGHLIQIKSQTFTNPAADGTTPWRCDSVLDLDAGMAYTWLPDGSVMSLSNAEIAAACVTNSITTFAFADVASTPVIMCEHYASTGASAAKYAGFKALWGQGVSDMPKRRTAGLLTPVDEARYAAALRGAMGAPAVTAIYAPTTALSVATTTSAANVDATNVKVSQVAGPTGKIIIHCSAWYEWSATDVLFWRFAIGSATANRCADTGVSGQKRLVTQTIEQSGLTPGQTYSCTLQHWTVSAGSATCKAGGTGGSMLPPVTILAISA